MRHVSREVICMRNRDGSVSKWLKISITCLFTEMAHFFSGILSYFEIEPSRFLKRMTSRETCLIRWLFEPSHHTPRMHKNLILLHILVISHFYFFLLEHNQMTNPNFSASWFCSKLKFLCIFESLWSNFIFRTYS